jgi:hypothetical protein
MQQTLHTCGHLPGPLVCHHALSAGRRLRASRPASRARRRCRDAHCGARSDAAEPQSDPEAERLFQQVREGVHLSAGAEYGQARPGPSDSVCKRASQQPMCSRKVAHTAQSCMLWSSRACACDCWRAHVQGFIQFRLSGEPLRLGVDDLNERLKVRGAQRMRQAFRPDEAHAMLFNFDGTFARSSYDVHISCLTHQADSRRQT